MADYTINYGYEFSQDLEYGDFCIVNSGGTLSHLKIDSGAKVEVNDGGIIDSATHFGDLIVSSGGMMKNTNLVDGAYVSLDEAVTSNVIISSGAIMSATHSIQDRTTVKMDGKLVVENCIWLVGELTLEEGADFSPVGGGTQVIFDYRGAFSSSSTPYINDISRVPDTFSYSVEFLNLPELGSYTLAGNAADFDGSITVKCNGKDDVTLTVGGPVVPGDNQAYSLTVSENNQLVFSVLGLDTFVNSDWTKVDVEYKIFEGTELVWQKNAFNNLAQAAAIVGSTNTLYIDGQWKNEWVNEGPDINLTGPSNVWIHAGTVRTVLEESIHGNGGTFHVDNDLIITKITGFSRVDIMGCELGIIANFDMPDNGILNFDVTKREVNATHAMLDIVPQHYGNLTITVSANQGVGSYSLLSYARGLDGKNIAVLGENNQQLGTLTVGGSDMVIGAKAYSLALNTSNTLIFTVKAGDTTPPDAPVAEASTTLPTNQNVTVTATFSDDTAVKEYSTDGTNWSAYTEGIVFSENGTVSFRGTDAAGNVSEVTSFAVTNIDKVPPTVPSLVPDITTPTNGNVTVVATFPNDAIQRQVSLDGVEWHGNNEQIVMTNNGWVYYRGIDAAGNISDVASYQVTNIDRIIPDAPVARADVTEPTNQNVVVGATFSTDSTVKEYSTDGVNWSAYTEGIIFSENGTVSFRGTDAAGNVSDVTSYAVTNIDKVPPTAPVAEADVTVPINQDVTVTATFSTDSTVKEYSMDGTNWSAYTEGIVFSENGTVSFRGTDAAGNVSDVTSYAVTNIDKVAPGKPTITSIPEPDTTTNGNVLVAANFTEDVVLIEFSLDGEKWNGIGPDFNYGQITMTNNGWVYFRGSDAAGNVSEVASFEVTNIDRIIPDAPEARADVTRPTNQNVTVTATFSDDSTVKEYSTDGTNWSAYTEGIVFSENGTVSFRGTDAAGNLSDVTSVAVTNIDKIAPDAPVAEASTTLPTNQNVTITATFSNDSTVKEYSTDGTNWSAYTEGIVFSENGTVSFRGTDAAGNLSDVTSVAVTNIDKIAPDAPVAEASTMLPTNQDVTVTATFSNDSTVKEYSTDGTNWSAYTEGIVLSENGTVSFRGTDAAGNLSEVTSVAVTNIDKIAPDAPVAEASTTLPTNQDVTVTATFSDDSVVKEYSTDGTNWSTYTEGIVFSENGTVSFRGTDAAGNLSEVTSVAVTNIDKIAPDAPVVTADGTWTLGNVTVTATFSDDSVVRAYSLDGTDWSDYTEGIVFSENGTVFFRGTDAAGNDSEVASYTVGNIVAPILLNGYGSGTLTADLPVPGAYGITGEFGDITGTVTVYNGGKKVGSGKVKKGVLSFNNGKAILLDSSLETKVEVKVQRGNSIDYSISLAAEKLFPKGDNSDDWTDLATKGAEGMVGHLQLGEEQSQVLSQDFKGEAVLEDWVGFSDAVDYKAFTLETAAMLSFDITASDAAKFTIYELVPPSGKKLDPASQLVRIAEKQLGRSSSGGKKSSSYSLSKKQTITLASQKGAEDYSGSTKGLLLEAGTYYIGVDSTNAKRGGDADYSVTLNGNSTFFTEGDNTDDDWTAAPRLEAGDALVDWVGFGDAVDYQTVTVDARGGFYSFQLSDVENNVKLSVYSVNAKGKLVKVKPVSASAKKPDVSTGPLVLAGDTQYVLAVEATGASSVKNSHYTVTMENLGLFFGEDNNSWDTATAIDGEYLGCLGKGAGADTVDYFDLSSWKNGFELEMESGKVKASFYNAEHKAVKLPTILCADGKVKSNVSSLSLLDGNATTDSIQIAAFDESVKYLKIKAEASGLNSFRIGMLA